MSIFEVSFLTSQLYTLSGNDGLVVSREGNISRNQESRAVEGAADNPIILVDGIVAAFESAISVSATGVARLDVGLLGVVRSGSGIGVALIGDSSVKNAGLVFGDFAAFDLRPGVGEVARVENSGRIIGSSYGFGVIFEADFGRIDVVNTGLIWGGLEAINFTDAGTSPNRVRNLGEMIGDVVLGGGNDVFDGRGGTLRGAVDAGEGGDLLVASTSIEDFDGGAGRDILDFSQGGAIRLSIAGSFVATGAAAGDTYAGFEVIIGARSGADRIEGGGLAELLQGLGGADTLAGGRGFDTIEGGIGIDRLSGGGGNDAFRFQTLSEIGDIVADFGDSAGNLDRFQIDASAFGGGLGTGTLAASSFRTRVDNVAQDSDDRFIFRTTDASLWFDRNGNVAGGPVLVADLQAGAVVTATDILLI